MLINIYTLYLKTYYYLHEKFYIFIIICRINLTVVQMEGLIELHDNYLEHHCVPMLIFLFFTSAARVFSARRCIALFQRNGGRRSFAIHKLTFNNCAGTFSQKKFIKVNNIGNRSFRFYSTVVSDLTKNTLNPWFITGFLFFFFSSS